MIADRRKQTVDQLNSFLRGEMSAVETYRLALERIGSTSAARPLLQRCLASHAQRVEILRHRIVEFGGTPSDDSGAWGAFVTACEGGAALLGDKLAITMLEEGEDHGLKDYRNDLKKLDAEARQMIAAELLPEQEQTHRAMSNLKHQLA
jgi:hypothetical protein